MYKIRVLRKLGWTSILLILATLFFLFPIYWMVTSSFKEMTIAIRIPPEWFPLTPTLSNFVTLFGGQYPVWRWLFNSIFTAVATALLVVLVSSMAAYSLAKIRFKSSKPLFGMMIGAMTLPNTLLIIPLFVIFSSHNLNNTYLGLILPVLGWPYGVFLLRQFMMSLPSGIIEAGKIDGCTEINVFLRVVIPLSKPGLATLGIFTFVRSWNDYVWQLVMLSSREMYTMPLAVRIISQMEFSTNYGVAMTGALVATLPVLILFLAFQKYFTKGITMGAVKG